MTVEAKFLESIPYFSELSPHQIDSIRGFFFEKTAERGEVILLEDESTDTLFFVVSGAVKVFKTSVSGKEQILNIVRPGEAINDVAIFDDGPNLASAEAMGPITLYGINKGELMAFLKANPQVALNIIKLLAERVRQLVSLVEDFSFRHVIGRVAKILLEYAGNGGGPRLTQQEMAAIAGTAREVVARSLKTLEEEGTIRLEHHRVIITDEEALKEMAETSG